MGWDEVLSEKKKTGVIWFVVVAYVILFTYAAISKLLDFETFTVQLAQSPLLSAYAGVIAWMVVGIELAIAFLLIIPKFRMLAFYAAFTLMVMFTVYIYIILNFSDFIPCSCGGVLEKLSWTQHLIFNVVFIILAVVAIFFFKHGNFKKKLLGIVLLAVMAISVVVLLFVFSEKKMQRNNAFQRRYMPHPIDLVHSFDLEYSSYYFAGIGNGSIYLGNNTAPLLMTVIDSNFTASTASVIQLDQMDLSYSSVKIRVVPPNFYVGDGTVPILLQGGLLDWKAVTRIEGKPFYSEFIPISPEKGIIKLNDTITGETILGLYNLEDSIAIKYNYRLLEKQVDGIFDTDGRMLFNRDLNKFIYTYYYRNQFIVAEASLVLDYRGKTIDTVSKAQLQIEEDKSKQQVKLGGGSLLINRLASTDGAYLYIETPRIGRHEPKDMVKEAAIIDVYNLQNNSYEFSFYLYRYKNKSLRDFWVSDGLLYALQGNYILVYKIDKKYIDK